MNFENKTKEELEEIYKAAVDAYEAGEKIMSDEEYDSLVNYLNVENEAIIGSVSKSSTYTVKHSFIMGSLDKVHTEEDDITNERNYQEVVDAINHHLSKSNNATYYEFTPKLDGCSFSVEVKLNKDKTDIVLTCATRGNGTYGKDITQQFKNSTQYNTYYYLLFEACEHLLNDKYDTLVIRGEALININTYNQKYADKFKNARVFVSGNLNADYDKDNIDYLTMCNDIDYITYDYRLVNSKTQEYLQLSYNNIADSTHQMIAPYLNGIGQTMSLNWCYNYNLSANGNKLDTDKYIRIYEQFEKFRKDFIYPLDGIVIKPNCSARLYNVDRERPEDQIAVKFVTQKMESIIKDIEWNVGRTGECYPVGIIEPVYQDGKKITRTSLHGYSYLKQNNAGIGSKVIIVMNGDIIPGVYSVETAGELVLPDFDTYVDYIGDNEIPHLMKKFSEDEYIKHKFINSVKALDVEGLKEKTAEKLWNDLSATRIGKLQNVMDLMNEDVYNTIIEITSKNCMTSAYNIINSLKKYSSLISLADIIRGLCIPGCGKRLSNIAADYILKKPGISEADINYKVLDWLKDSNSVKYSEIHKYLNMFNMNISDMMYDENVSESNDIIKVILTGDPSKCTSYKTKKDWLNAHPQYVETTKWKDCAILFTNDIESKSSKMDKAEKNNIEIKLYED